MFSWAALLVALTAVVSCGVPTEPRWDRVDDDALGASADSEGSAGAAASLPFEVAELTTYRIESAPVVAAVTVPARVLPATETVVTAPSSGRIGRVLAATGDPVRAGDPVLSWTTGPSEPTAADVLRVEILEREIQLAELEGRADDAAASAAQLEALQPSVAEDEVVLVAPQDGVIGRFIAARSRTHETGADVFSVGDPAALRIDLELGAGQFLDVAVGTEVRVVDAQDRFAEPTSAVVVSVEPTATATATDTATDTATAAGTGERLVSAELAIGAPLAVGERVLVDVDQSSGDASRSVSADAVLGDRRGSFLIVADDDGNWARVDIEIGVASGDTVEVLADIEVGTVVIVP